jgi:DNA-binding transcriptional regulator YiaG
MLHYRASGLDHVVLVNGYETVESSGKTFIRIHSPDALHAAIGHFLATKPGRLTGQELRYLRRGIDLSQEELGNLLEYQRPQVVQWEKGDSEIPVPVELAVRAMYLGERENAPLGLELANLVQGSVGDPEPLVFRETPAGWEHVGVSPTAESIPDQILRERKEDTFYDSYHAVGDLINLVNKVAAKHKPVPANEVMLFLLGHAANYLREAGVTNKQIAYGVQLNPEATET